MGNLLSLDTHHPRRLNRWSKVCFVVTYRPRRSKNLDSQCLGRDFQGEYIPWAPETYIFRGLWFLGGQNLYFSWFWGLMVFRPMWLPPRATYQLSVNMMLFRHKVLPFLTFFCVGLCELWWAVMSSLDDHFPGTKWSEQRVATRWGWFAPTRFCWVVGEKNRPIKTLKPWCDTVFLKNIVTSDGLLKLVLRWMYLNRGWGWTSP